MDINELNIQAAPLDDLRALLDPQGHRRSLENARNVLRDRLSQVFVDIDLTSDNPAMTDEDKESVLTNYDRIARDIAWRMQEIDRRLKMADESLGMSRRRLSEIKPDNVSELHPTEGDAPSP